MPSRNASAEVIDLNAARRARNRQHRVPNQHVPAPRRERDAQTVILNAILSIGQENIQRHIGINDSKTLEDLRKVIDICFGFTKEPSPWAFIGEGILNEADPIHFHLSVAGESIKYRYGLWTMSIDVVDSIVRDDSTPQAVCIGGDGDMPYEPLDTSKINEQITAVSGDLNVLELVRPEVAELIERSGVYDFLPLLQALGLTKPNQSEPSTQKLKDLPVEEKRKARDAFWAMILSLACMGEEELTDSVAVSLMSALGYGELDIEDITGLCAESLAVVETLGGYGEDPRSAVERIDVYRELLRK